MGEHTSISWTDHTWNPWIGCARVSPACDGCYAAALMETRMGRVEWGGPGKGAGTRARTSARTWNDPFRWHRRAEAEGTRPFVFCASLADIFDNQVDPVWRREAFDVMRRTPRLVYLLLTKRPGNIVKLAEEAGGLPPNAALGTTCENQPIANRNLRELQWARAILRPLFTFGSFEPLLGPIEIDSIDMPGWVITGGETDQGVHRARPTHPDWFRSLRDQCAAAGVPFHHKQWGEWKNGSDFAADAKAVLNDGTICDPTPDALAALDRASPVPPRHPTMMRRVGKHAAGRLLDDVLHDARPAVPDLEQCA